MDRRKLLRPMGPLPPSVYWMRRAAIALIGFGVIVLVGVLVLRAIPGSSSAAGQSSPTTPPRTTASTPATTARTTALTTPPTTATPTASSTSTSSPTATAALPACVGADVAITVVSTDRAYLGGAEPEFTATVKPGTPCRTAAPVFEVTSGPDRVWGSADCVTDASTSLTGTYERTIRWDLKRSSPGCASVFGTTTATAGTYHVVATVAGVTSTPVRFAIG